MDHFETLLVLLRDRPTFLEEVRQGKRLESKILSLLVVSSLFFAIYGAIHRFLSRWVANAGVDGQAASPVPVDSADLSANPVLFRHSVVVPKRLQTVHRLSLTTVAVISVLLFSFAPITLFFLISIQSYHFFLLLNVAIFNLTGLIG
jgi:hypothetical protein